MTQLRELGVRRIEIAAIVLSHFHADHIAGVLDFPGVKVYCSREGWAALHARPRLSALRQGLLAELAPSALREHVRFIEDGADPPRRRLRIAVTGASFGRRFRSTTCSAMARSLAVRLARPFAGASRPAVHGRG